MPLKSKGRNANKEGWTKTLKNVNKRIDRATKQGKSKNYISDLEKKQKRVKDKKKA